MIGSAPLRGTRAGLEMSVGGCEGLERVGLKTPGSLTLRSHFHGESVSGNCDLWQGPSMLRDFYIVYDSNTFPLLP